MTTTTKLPPSISTTQDLKSLIVEIRAYAKWAANQSIKERTGVKSDTAPPALSPIASELIAANDKFDDLIASLDHIAANAPRVNITLAAPPTKGIKTALTDWCRQNLAPDILVSFDFNTTILGGMVVRHGSHVYDWSFRRQILANRAAFPATLHPDTSKPAAG
jgi:hypothetical protein